MRTRAKGRGATGGKRRWKDSDDGEGGSLEGNQPLVVDRRERGEERA